jgi:hypothetical protein
MKILLSVFGLLALGLAIADLIHGPHNGDVHRTYIHVPEFICFFGFLCLLEILAFHTAIRELDTSPWLIAMYFSICSSFLGFVLFDLVGGSPHGDGGPIAFSFLLLATIGLAAIPISFISFTLVAIIRKRKSAIVLEK